MIERVLRCISHYSTKLSASNWSTSRVALIYLVLPIFDLVLSLSFGIYLEWASFTLKLALFNKVVGFKLIFTVTYANFTEFVRFFTGCVGVFFCWGLRCWWFSCCCWCCCCCCCWGRFSTATVRSDSHRQWHGWVNSRAPAICRPMLVAGRPAVRSPADRSRGGYPCEVQETKEEPSKGKQNIKKKDKNKKKGEYNRNTEQRRLDCATRSFTSFSFSSPCFFFGFQSQVLTGQRFSIGRRGFSAGALRDVITWTYEDRRYLVRFLFFSSLFSPSPPQRVFLLFFLRPFNGDNHLGKRRGNPPPPNRLRKSRGQEDVHFVCLFLPSSRREAWLVARYGIPSIGVI